MAKKKKNCAKGEFKCMCWQQNLQGKKKKKIKKNAEIGNVPNKNLS